MKKKGVIVVGESSCIPNELNHCTKFKYLTMFYFNIVENSIFKSVIIIQINRLK